jgi:cytochrome c peroxidase
MNVPEDNQPNACRIELGKKLFFDPGLSSDGKTSCSSCHQLSAAFTDGQKVSLGHDLQKGKRNSPTLFNVGWQPHLMSEGGVKNLELQALAPLLSDHEMFHSALGIPVQLLQDSCYQQWSRKAYGRGLDYYVITRALACYERSLISFDTPFDLDYYFHQSPMNERAQRGWKLFQSEKLACLQCHTLPFFTDFDFHSIGLADTLDHGKERESYQQKDRFRFKTPTLRNVELTGPYMHDGSLQNLTEVIEFYNRGGDRKDARQDDRIRPLGLTEDEKKDLIAFLESLTDWNAVQKQSYLPLEQ